MAITTPTKKRPADNDPDSPLPPTRTPRAHHPPTPQNAQNLGTGRRTPAPAAGGSRLRPRPGSPNGSVASSINGRGTPVRLKAGIRERTPRPGAGVGGNRGNLHPPGTPLARHLVALGGGAGGRDRSPSIAPSAAGSTYSKAETFISTNEVLHDIQYENVAEYQQHQGQHETGVAKLRRSVAGQALGGGVSKGTILSRDEVLKVYLKGEVSGEVGKVLAGTDLDSSSVRAVVEPSLHFAAVVTRSKVYAWNYSKKSSTTYTFPTPDPTSPLPPHLFFLPPSTPSQSREPGILLIPSGGMSEQERLEGTVSEDIFRGEREEAVVWERVGLSLGREGEKRGERRRLGLKVGEGVKGVERVDTYTFLLYTTHSRILRLSLTLQAGRTHFNPPTAFLKPTQSWISRSSDILFSSTSTSTFNSDSSTADQGIIAVGLGAEYHPGLGARLIESPDADAGAGGVNGTPMGKGKERASLLGPNGVGGGASAGAERRREVWVLAGEEGKGVLQGWTMDGKGQKLLKEFEVFDDIVEATSTVNIKLVDIAVKKDGKIAVLVQHALGGQARFTAYAIAVIDPSEDAKPRVQHLVHLDYADNGEDDSYSARLLVSHDSELAFVQSPGAVLTCSLQKECFYQSATELKQPSYNTIIGTSFDLSNRAHRKDPQASDATLFKVFALAAATGVLCVEVDELKAEEYGAKSVEDARALSLRSRIEQSIQLDGSSNPLKFSWGGTSDEQFGEAILAVSNGITTSQSPYHRPHATMTYDLQDRLEKQFKLVVIINARGEIGRLPKDVRRSLAVDAEVLHAAAEVRELLDESDRLGFWDSHIPLGLLGKAVIDTMSSSGGIMSAEEAIHAFFESKLRSLPQVLLTAAATAAEHSRRLAQTAGEDALVALTDWTLETARIFRIAFYRAEQSYKGESLATYDINRVDWAQAPGWMVNAQMLATFNDVYHQSVRVIEQRTAFYGVQVDEVLQDEHGTASSQQQQKQAELKGLVSDMAGPLISALQEEAHTLLRTLEDDPNSPVGLEKRGQLLQDEHDVLISLIPIDTSTAWTLAEKWQVVETLAVMATRSDIGATWRIATYLEGDLNQRLGRNEALGKRFAKCLFEGYLKSGHYEAILQYSTKYSEIVRKFLERQGRNDLVWLYYLTHAKNEEAGIRLKKAAEAETDAKRNRTLLSIAKLTKMATLPTESRDAEFHDIDTQLYLHKSVESLRNRFIALVPATDDLRDVARHFTEQRCRRLAQEDDLRPFYEYYESNCAKLIREEVIDREETIDLLTMKDVVDEDDVGDFIVALKIVRSWIEEGNDETRKVVCLRSIWRRLYSADDWERIVSRNDGDADIDSWFSDTKLIKVLRAFHGELEQDYFLTPSAAREPFPTHILPRRYEHESGAWFMAVLQKEGELLDEVEGLNDGVVNELVEMVAREENGEEGNDMME